MMMQADKGGKRNSCLSSKATSQGSVEAIDSRALEKLGTDEGRARIIHAGGRRGLPPLDVALAEASGAIIVAFNIHADAKPSNKPNATESRFAITTSSTTSWTM